MDIRRVWCRLAHRTIRSRLFLLRPEACAKNGVSNPYVVRCCCLRCGNLFRWSVR